MSSSTLTSERATVSGFSAYARTLLLTAATLLGLTAAVNAWVDPFDQLGNNRIGFYADMEREAKSAWLPRGDYAGVILGSSKPTYIDPTALDRGGFFNAAFALAMPEELLAFAQTFVEPGQAVLLGLDLYMFNENAFPLQQPVFRAQPSLGDLAGYLFSGQVLIYSVRDYMAHLRGRPPRLEPAGNLAAVQRLARHEAMDGRIDAPVLGMLRSVHYRDFRYAEARLESLRRLKALFQARGNPFVVFINPLSRTVLDHLATLPAAPMLDRLRQDLREIFPDLVDLSDSRWSDPDNFLRFDALHYLPEVGAAFVNQELLPRLPGPASESGREPPRPTEPIPTQSMSK